MLLAKGKIMPDMVALLDKWRHTGFNVFAGSRIMPRQEKSMENLARYYGYYSNVSREKRKKAGSDDKIPCILEPELSTRAFRRNWAQLIQKICEVDPLLCPKCSPKSTGSSTGTMRVIAFVGAPGVIRKS